MRRLGPLLLLALLPSGGAAQEAVTSPDGSTLSIALVTMGPGTRVWERFGHNAVWVRDTISGFDRVYNYGMFSFQQEGYVQRFLQGRLLYWMMGFESPRHFGAYVAADRSLWVQELNLTPEQRAELAAFLEWNDTPENRFYRYDYYLDNCSTRIRDARSSEDGYTNSPRPRSPAPRSASIRSASWPKTSPPPPASCWDWGRSWTGRSHSGRRCSCHSRCGSTCVMSL